MNLCYDMFCCEQEEGDNPLDFLISTGNRIPVLSSELCGGMGGI